MIDKSNIGLFGMNTLTGDALNDKLNLINEDTRLDIKHMMQNALIYDSNIEDWYTRWCRFGCIDPYNTATSYREYIFFTKPDLNIFKYSTGSTLQSELKNNLYFNELLNSGYLEVLDQLRIKPSDSGFLTVLTNALSVDQTLDLPSISIGESETGSTFEGASMKYPWTSIESDMNHDFTLEFQDTKYLEVYRLFKAWDEYERLKALGLVSPSDYHRGRQEVHDQIAVYKIIVGEDGKTILYWAKGLGVYPKGVPRDVFSSLASTVGPIKYSVAFNCQFVQDSDPWIIRDFNTLASKTIRNKELPIYNPRYGSVDGEWASGFYINYHDKDSVHPFGRYTLDWYSK